MLHVWSIFLQNWVIYGDFMLVNIPYMEHMGIVYLVGGDWNMDFIFPFSWECHHPRSHELLLFRGVGQPPTRYVYSLVN